MKKLKFHLFCVGIYGLWNYVNGFWHPNGFRLELAVGNENDFSPDISSPLKVVRFVAKSHRQLTLIIHGRSQSVKDRNATLDFAPLSYETGKNVAFITLIL